MSASQLTMFEPEGSTLAQLVATHQRNAEFEQRRAENLAAAGYLAAAATSRRSSDELRELAAVCETALQLEQLAGLS